MIIIFDPTIYFFKGYSRCFELIILSKLWIREGGAVEDLSKVLGFALSAVINVIVPFAVWTR